MIYALPQRRHGHVKLDRHGRARCEHDALEANDRLDRGGARRRGGGRHDRGDNDVRALPRAGVFHDAFKRRSDHCVGVATRRRYRVSQRTRVPRRRRARPRLTERGVAQARTERVRDALPTVKAIRPPRQPLLAIVSHNAISLNNISNILRRVYGRAHLGTETTP